MLLNNAVASWLQCLDNKNGTALALFGVFERFLVEVRERKKNARDGGPCTSVRFRVSRQGVEVIGIGAYATVNNYTQSIAALTTLATMCFFSKTAMNQLHNILSSKSLFYKHLRQWHCFTNLDAVHSFIVVVGLLKICWHKFC